MGTRLSASWMGAASLFWATSLALGPAAFAAPTTLRVDLHAATNFTPTERAKLDAAIDVIETVLNSPEFQQRVLDFTWKGERTYADNAGLSNEEILEAILAAKESFSPSANGTMDIEVDIYNSGPFGGNVVGYTNKGSKTTHVNRRFFRNFTPAQVAANLVHEWTHMLGFSHDYRSTPQRPYSVPYAMGSLVNQVAKELGVGQQ